MEHVRVTSSNIYSVGYDPQKHTLEIRFIGKDGKAGSLYSYRNVPQRLYEGLLKAPSKGEYFSMFIKGNSQYPFRRVT